ncbi:MAG: hypothetical protein U0324_30765 [Polyangiales bacterium]
MSPPKPTNPRRTDPPPPNRVAATATDASPPDLPQKEAFEQHRAEAEKLPEDALPDAVTADLAIALHNARVGAENVSAERDRLARELPRAPLAQMLALPNLVRGAMFAGSRSGTARAVTREEIDAKLVELQAVRVPALLQLQVFKAKGLADGDEVDRIVAGRGALNHAQDGVDLERVFTENRARWAGKHPFTDAEIAEAGRLGNWLLDHVQPDGAVKRAAKPDAYDRLQRAFWALALDAHKQLRKAAVVLWGEDELDARVPKLQARQVTRARNADEPADPAKPDAPADPT